MFSGFTSAAIITAATPFASEIVTPALVVVGIGLALGLASWVVKRFRRAAR